MQKPTEKLVTMKVKEGVHRRLSTLSAQKGLPLSETIDDAVDAAIEAGRKNPARRRVSFDDRVEKLGRIFGKPEHLVDALVYVHDTVDQAWVAALDIFGDEATPEVALKLYDRIHSRRLELVQQSAKELHSEEK